MRAQVFAHSCLVMCVPASHILMHSALLSSMALLLVRVAVSGAAGRALAGGAGAMVAVWAATAPTLKTSIVDITGMRMAIPRKAELTPVGDGYQPEALGPSPSCPSQRRRRL